MHGHVIGFFFALSWQSHHDSCSFLLMGYILVACNNCIPQYPVIDTIPCRSSHLWPGNAC